MKSKKLSALVWLRDDFRLMDNPVLSVALRAHGNSILILLSIPEDISANAGKLSAAGMRQLLSTGFIHNRPRMIAASFLTKHLRIAWTQAKKFDPQGEYASTFIPASGDLFGGERGTIREPIIRLDEEREKTLSIYYLLRKGDH